MIEVEKTKSIVTSVQEKLNQIIEKYLNQYYNKSLGIEDNNAN